jgi:hypothetical protein
MSLIDGDVLAEEEADDLAPCSMPGMEDESPEEPQAASVRARAAAVQAAARARRRPVEREEANIEQCLSGGHATPMARE